MSKSHPIAELYDEIDKISWEYASSYPDIQEVSYWEKLYAIKQTLAGLSMANSDVHNEWKLSKQALAAALTEAERVKELLRESYVFIAFPHKAHAPWRNALNEWQLRVEAETGWNAYQEIENYKSQ